MEIVTQTDKAMSEQLPRIYKASELAEILNVSPKTIYAMGQRGEIKSYKVGRLTRFEMPNERTKQCVKNQSE